MKDFILKSFPRLTGFELAKAGPSKRLAPLPDNLDVRMLKRELGRSALYVVPVGELKVIDLLDDVDLVSSEATLRERPRVLLEPLKSTYDKIFNYLISQVLEIGDSKSIP